MSNPIRNWWRSRQFKSAIKQGNTRLALQMLREIQKSGAKLSFAEKLFRDKLKTEEFLQAKNREIATLSSQLHQAFRQIESLELQLTFDKPDDLLTKNDELIKFITESFKLIHHDENKLQVTGIHEDIFNQLEADLVKYLQKEFSKIPDKQLIVKLEDALEDINNLKCGQDPDYRFSLTPHVYFMKYFLENVYCVYLAWFLIYQAGLLPNKVNILDIAAGPGTVAYGLALFLQSSSGFLPMPQMHISYYSLEKQDAFQFRGLQFWRQYIESQQNSTNAYFRFVTSDILTWDAQSQNIPKDFFDFIVISHCFFAETDKRIQANNTYKEIFGNSLKSQGYVLLIIQDKKLFKTYDVRQSEDNEQEKKLIIKFVTELGLQLVWYKYLTSTDSRVPCSGAEFAKFAQEKLQKQMYMSPILQQYLHQKYQSHYTLDDYVILAKK